MNDEFFDKLLNQAQKIPEPLNLFSGRVLNPEFRLPDNILVFYHDFTTALPNAHGRHTIVIPFDPMTYFVDQKKIKLQPGVMLHIPPYAVRFIHNDPPGYRRLFITFETRGTQTYIPAPGVFRFTKKSQEALKKFLNSYNSARVETAAFMLTEFLLLQQQTEPQAYSDNMLPDAVANVVELAASSLSHATCIKDIANETDISESHLRKIFKSSTGISLGRFLKEKKLDFAKYHLRYSEKRIADIAVECGFANIYVFSAFFKRNVGYSPLQYRKEKLKISSAVKADIEEKIVIGEAEL